VIQKLIEAAADERNHGYSKSNGIANLRREVASKYNRKYGVRLDPEHEIIACLGSKEGFSHMCLALMGPGDTAIIPAPYFPIHMYGVILASGNVVALDVPIRQVSRQRRLYLREPDAAAEGADRQLPAQPFVATIEPGFFRRSRPVGASKYGFMVITISLMPMWRSMATTAQLPRRSRGQGSGRRVHHDEQGVQHGGLARRLLRRPRLCPKTPPPHPTLSPKLLARHLCSR
jgi:hypothetical protein